MFSFFKYYFRKNVDIGSIDASLHIEIDKLPKKIGIIAGNSNFPVRVAELAKIHGFKTIVLAHEGETPDEINNFSDELLVVKLGELDKSIRFFKNHDVENVVFAGGINRIKGFDSLKPDSRAAALLLKIRSTKDDHLMRGIASELHFEGINVLPCTLFMNNDSISKSVITMNNPDQESLNDIEVGRQSIHAMSDLHIGQTVAIKDGVVIAVEAVEGTDRMIQRIGDLRIKGATVVKLTKKNQDLRFDIPTVGIKTIELLHQSNVKTLALEAGRSIILDKDHFIELANKYKIAVIGI